MVAPWGAGATLVASPATLTAVNYPGVTTASTQLTSINNSFRWQQNGSSAGTVYGGRHVLSSAVNMTNKAFVFAFGASLRLERASNIPASASTTAGYMFAIFDSLGNYRRWVIGGGNQTSFTGLQEELTPTTPACVDPSYTATMQGESSPAPDLTNITAIEFHGQSSGVDTGPFDMRVGKIYTIPTTGVVLSGGEVANKANLEDLIDYQSGLDQFYTLKSLAAGTVIFNSSIKLAADYFEGSGSTIIFEPTANFFSGATNVRVHHEPTLTLDIPASATFALSDFQVKSEGDYTITKTIGASATVSYDTGVISNPTTQTLEAESFDNVIFKNGESITIDGASISGSTINTLSANPSLIVSALGTDKDFRITNLSGVVRVNLAAGDYSTWTSTFDNDQAINMNGGGGTYNLTGLSGGTSGNPVVFDAIDGGNYTIQIDTGLFATVADPITSGAITLEAPQTQIVVSGIPEVAGAILAVVDLSDSSVTYPTLSSGGATIPTDPLKSYRLIAKAPGYERQSVTLAGTGGTFEFELNDNTAYYNAAASTAEITIDFASYTITVGDGINSLTFEILFSTLEDLFSTEEGILNNSPPYPVVVASRNYLIFPLSGGSPSDVTIIPDPANLSDPTIIDVVLIKLGATDEVWDLFDFSGASGRIIKIQSESVAATVEGSSLSPTQATWLQELHAALETSGVFSADALQNSPASTLDAQAVADALKLSPTAGAVATGSVYNLLNVLDTNVDSLIVGVNVATVGGNVVEDAFDPATDAVIVGTNNDKSGYSLTQSFPANFSQLGISIEGYINRVVNNTDMRGTDGALLAGNYTAPDNTAIADIKTKTDQLTFTVANQVDSNALTGGGGDDAETIFTYFSGQGYTATRAGYLDKLNLPGTLTQTSDLPTNFANLAIAETTGLVSIGTLPTIPTNWLTASGIAADAIAKIQSGLSTLTEASVRSAVGLLTANLDTQLAAIGTDIDAVLVDTGTAIPNTLATLLTSVNDLPDDVAAQSAIAQLILQVDRVHLIHGLEIGTPLVVSETSRTAGDLAQTISTVDDISTVTRTA